MGRFLITGGAGYIGSHVVKRILENGSEVFVIDDLSTGHKKVSDILGFSLYDRPISDYIDLSYIGKIDCVIHLAGFSQVSESVLNPNKYYTNNIFGTIQLLQCMRKNNIKNIVFSSSASVYGNPTHCVNIRENDLYEYNLKPTNTYGRTKLMIEEIIKDYAKAYGINYIFLRYFNAAGADLNGKIGEDHRPETHLIPLIMNVALGKNKYIDIFGSDYKTHDGTCIRDYIHVNDLAWAHIIAADHLLDGGVSNEYNLGLETGYSVKQIIDIAKYITKKDILYNYLDKREGDPASLVASAIKIKKQLYWRPEYDIEDIIETAWNWHRDNPNGYGD